MSIQEETIAVRAGENFDLQKVERYLLDHIQEIGEGSLQVRQFPSGASNLTYLLQIGDWGLLERIFDGLFYVWMFIVSLGL